jgi:hypothetical protein
MIASHTVLIIVRPRPVASLYPQAGFGHFKGRLTADDADCAKSCARVNRLTVST